MENQGDRIRLSEDKDIVMLFVLVGGVLGLITAVIVQSLS